MNARLQIPPEIWTLVAQYLPKDTLLRLASVNATFYTLAMDERYNRLDMRRINGTFVRTLEALKGPDHRKRVQSLHLVPPCLHELAIYENVHHTGQPNHSIRTLAGRLLQKLSLRKQSDNFAKEDLLPPASELTDALAAILPTLQNVTKITLTWNSVSMFDAPYLTSAWGGLFANLQELHLDLHPLYILSRLLPYNLDFPSLSSLKFNICSTESGETPGVIGDIVEAISTFTNKFEHTLRSLNISSGQKRPLSRLYDELTRFPKLHTFEVNPSTILHPLNLINFLQRHSDVLSSLTFISDSSPLLSDGLSELRLQTLQTLTMRIDYVPYPTPWWTVATPSPFFNSIASTLRVLTIEGAVTTKELLSLLNNLSRPTAGEPALQTLSVAIYSLYVESLVEIAERLPRLRSLNLRIHNVMIIGHYPITPDDMFPFGINQKQLHPLQTTHSRFIQSAKDTLCPLTWNIQDLTIKRRACCGDLVLWGLIQMIAECLPTISSFAKQGVKVVPQVRNERDPGFRSRCTDIMCPFGPRDVSEVVGPGFSHS